MLRRALSVVMLTVGLAGCSGSGGGVSTASILGGESAPAAGAVAAIPPASKPSDRAFQAGAVSARATKCGYNFDADQLRASYLAHEAGRGASNDEVSQLTQVYNVAHNGVMKASAEDPDYCNQRRTNEIKADLGRLLAGDFEPPRRQAAPKQEDGLFSGWFDGGAGSSGPSFGSEDWWEQQREKTGG